MKTDKPNPPKLLLDEQIWEYLAALLREQGFDVIHVYEAGLDKTPDLEILQSAVENHLTVVTFNTKHFIPLALQYAQRIKSIMALWFPTKSHRAN